ncbi:IS701 family transposase [Deinococcus sp. NW-56]|uniref:IS701 family transposase n=1 Tax=Deinococcus sp. NW-56 TaxID=2080419 RepID=UPI000CF57FEF|nr:IS701 family transposase [Deinococcus sp. NW-56]
MARSLPRWTRHFPTWFAPFLVHFRHRAQRTWAPLYVRGLCSTVHRKSMQPLAAVVAPGKENHLQQFITDSPWLTEPLETLLAQRAQQMLGGKDAVLIIDDTCLTKFGTKSVGVARQYSGQVGKITPCQCLVSLTLAQHDLPVPLALRLFLPQEWTNDPARLRAAGVPLEHQPPQTKCELALKELDRVRPHVTFGMVLADAGYGVNARFRQALTERGLLWSVGITRTQTVYPRDVRLIPIPRIFRGRKPTHPTPSEDRLSVEEVLAGAAWQHLVWRHGTKGPLSGRFAAEYVRLADGEEYARSQHLPGQAAWIIGEQRRGEERKYYVCNLPPDTPLSRLVEVTKRRWACELSHRELKDEVGLDHFEGRSWQGLHHHAVLCMVALTFLQWLRLTQPDDLRGDTIPAIRAEVAGDLPLPPPCRRCHTCTALFSGP